MNILKCESGKISFGLGQVLIAAASVALAAIAWIFFDQAEIPPVDRDSAPVSRVVVEPAGMRSFDVSVRTIGRVRPWREVFLAPEVSGRVEEVLVEIGDRVAAGENLLRIDRGPYEDTVREREAAQLRAQARLTEATANLERMAQLRGRGGISEREYDAALAEKLAGEADLRAADAALARARRNLNDTSLQAPFAGTIVGREVDPGALIGADRGVLMLADLDIVAIEVGLTEQELLQIRRSRTAEISTASLPGVTALGTIEGIAERADPDTGTYAARIRVDNREQPAFLGGMVVDVDISVRRIEQAMAVPEAAVLEASSDPHLYVVEGGRAQKVPVRVIARNGGMLGVEDASGTAGLFTRSQDGRAADVVVVGQSILGHGDAVEVVDSQ
jgi:RND family efflux transporter MFP subunit